MKVWFLVATLVASACHVLGSGGGACRDFTNCPKGQICCDGECRPDGCLTPCAPDSACPPGSTCNPELRACVPPIEVGCDRPDQICPADIRTGDSCPSEGSFIPCRSDAVDCERGCRTCTNGLWSECSAGTCTVGMVSTCATCTDDCTETVLDATPACIDGGDGFACDYTGPCAAGSADADGVRENGCEGTCVPTNGGFERCDGADNDCNGTIDDLSVTDVGIDCTAQFDQTNVAAWACLGGRCLIESCNADQYDLNGELLDGCEYTCNSSGGAEVCDGVDNDCNGVTDDVAFIDVECTTQFPNAERVQAFACVAGACVVAACDAGARDADGLPATGCEQDCDTPSAEVCDGADNDCNGWVDDGDDAGGCSTLFRDGDGDGDGDPAAFRCLCGPTDNYTATAGDDCDDDDPARSSLRGETCDHVDNDCDDIADNGLTDCRCTTGAPLEREICFNGIDDNCNGVVDDGCSCPPSQAFCSGDRSTLATCDATGNLPVASTVVRCEFLCSRAACADASNIPSTDVALCRPSAPTLEPPAGSTLTYVDARLRCNPHCGDGTTAELAPLTAVTFPDTRLAQVFCLGRVHLPADLEVFAMHEDALVLLSAGDAIIDGELRYDGGDAPDGEGLSLPAGSGGPGGWSGAPGCTTNFCAGTTGDGPGGGTGGFGSSDGSSGGGGGGGFGGGGGNGGDAPNGTGGSGGAPYGEASLIPLAGGSGGGSGGDGDGGAGSGPGGGGGGVIQISARGDLVVNGVIRACGGDGGSPGANFEHGPGGGGAGGAVLLEAASVSIPGTVVVAGGDGGSNTGAGAGGLGAFDGLNGDSGGDGTSFGGGGGGGGAGRVRINSATGAACSPAVQPTPACSAGVL